MTATTNGLLCALDGLLLKGNCTENIKFLQTPLLYGFTGRTARFTTSCLNMHRHTASNQHKLIITK